MKFLKVSGKDTGKVLIFALGLAFVPVCYALRTVAALWFSHQEPDGEKYMPYHIGSTFVLVAPWLYFVCTFLYLMMFIGMGFAAGGLASLLWRRRRA